MPGRARHAYACRAPGRSVEQIVQEALVPLVAIVAVVAVVVAAERRGGRRVAGVLRWVPRGGRVAGRGRRRGVTTTAVHRRGRGRRRGLLRSGRRAGRLPGVVGGLGLEELLQFAAVEEDAAALGALIDGDATALVHAHIAVTLRTGHLLHKAQRYRARSRAGATMVTAGAQTNRAAG